MELSLKHLLQHYYPIFLVVSKLKTANLTKNYGIFNNFASQKYCSLWFSLNSSYKELNITQAAD